ncbi:MAG: P-loop NTPase, partial [Deltaproteobacteria bacterium]|nr:P-loop NTPase [Deltaproteobacteria bacterium]
SKPDAPKPAAPSSEPAKASKPDAPKPAAPSSEPAKASKPDAPKPAALGSETAKASKPAAPSSEPAKPPKPGEPPEVSKPGASSSGAPKPVVKASSAANEKPASAASKASPPKAAPAGKPVRVITVSSGKGGVGKSNITLGLALALAGLGRKVLIWDADLGLANTDVLLGLRTQVTIHHWLKGEKTLKEIILKGPKGISILPAASGILELNEISEAQKARLIAEFEQWQEDLDFLLIDTAAGIGPNVIFFNLVAQERLVILNNEPTSITDAYALIKALNTKHKQSGFYLLPNMVTGPKEAKAVFQLMSNVAGQYLTSVSLDLAGYIPYDESVPASVRKQTPFYILYPDCPASLRVTELARYLIGREPPAFGAGGLVLFLNRLVAVERAVD